MIETTMLALKIKDIEQEFLLEFGSFFNGYIEDHATSLQNLLIVALGKEVKIDNPEEGKVYKKLKVVKCFSGLTESRRYAMEQSNGFTLIVPEVNDNEIKKKNILNFFSMS
jgi:hypothetical protein